MPRPTPQPARRTAAATAPDPAGTVRFSPVNWLILALALVCIVAGYVLLNGGSTVAAPLLLVLGYVVLIPVGIIK